jgi:transcriptional regulator with XRE-family HTH domain
MPPIGETLRDARMRRGLDIADIEQRTKIRAKYLRALEGEEWDQLPGPTFVRTFLRTYAEVVGLDAALLIEEFRVSHEPEQAELAPLTGPPAAVGRERRRPPGPPPRAAIAAVLVIAFVGFLVVLGLSGDKPEDGSNPTRTTPAAERPRPRPDRRPAPARGVTVRIAPEQPTYVCLDTGEQSEVLFEGTLEAARTFRDPRRLRLNLGRRAVRVSANGEPFPIDDSPEPLGLEVDRSGAREIVDGLRPCG